MTDDRRQRKQQPGSPEDILDRLTEYVAAHPPQPAAGIVIDLTPPSDDLLPSRIKVAPRRR
ncbi:MAG: hypothetical protein ACT4OX_07715 [Actinomycetota bacterium]